MRVPVVSQSAVSHVRLLMTNSAIDGVLQAFGEAIGPAIRACIKPIPSDRGN